MFSQDWVARSGAPREITSDRREQVMSSLWKGAAQLLIMELLTSAFHPLSNGLVKHFHQTLRVSMQACLYTPSLLYELLWVMLGLNMIPKTDLVLCLQPCYSPFNNQDHS